MFKARSRKGASAMTLAILAIGFVVAGVVIAVGAQINGELSEGLDQDGKEIVGNSTAGLKKFAKFMPLLATVFVGAIIISALFMFKDVGGGL